jgi:hypothetical protein
MKLDYYFDFEELRCEDLPNIPIPDVDASNPKYKKMMLAGTKTRRNAADGFFSKAVRLLAVKRHMKKYNLNKPSLFLGKTPIAECITCKRKQPIKAQNASDMLQCGHYIVRKPILTRFHFKNCNAQCHYCNEKLKGDQARHGREIDKIHGTGTRDHLMDQGDIKGVKFGSWHYLTIEVWCKEIIKELKEEIGIPDFKM